MTWQDLHHSELTVPQLYALLKLRSEVFVVEQQCVYQDVDGDDLVGENRHLLGWRDGELVAYARILKSEEEFAPVVIGRVIVSPAARGAKLGYQLMEQAQIVVQLGSSLTGKRVLQWQATCEPDEYWLVDNLPGRLDPAQHRGRRLLSSVERWLELHPAEKRQPWATVIPQLAGQAWQAAVASNEPFGEAQLAQRIRGYLPEQGQLFVGNSLVVRLIDALAQLPAGYPVYSNRGASGIDGLIATAAGVQRASARPTLAIVGDLSALYDLNSLALLRQASAPLVLIVVNNNGGQIFSMLPTPQDERRQFYLMPQDVDFSHAAAMFGLAYHRPDDWPSLDEALAGAWRRAGATVIELAVNETDGAQTLQQLLAQVSRL
ncbi:GNAT family N-acetyltransferase [Klebsiella pneumoniae]|nr:GNAT family N-acetyltransferase [Klebsiella pneumoniae]